MECHRGHRVHVRLGDILDNDWNIIVPTSDSFIVRCRDESSIVVHEGNGVDWPKMLIIGLHDLMGSQVILNVWSAPSTQADLPG